MQLPSLIGKYASCRNSWAAACSTVYRARDTAIERARCRSKILTGRIALADPESKARFLHEAKIAGGIQHENIVSVFDYGDHAGRPYIVMEYLEGEDLRNAIRENHTGNLANRLRIATDIAAALEYVHERGIIHRDIKPENVHIARNGKVKLMDFGIAKTANLSLTRTGMAMGTPYYMAPEQVAGRATTPLVDIYAFGMLFYELLTGVRGIQGDTMEQLFYQIINVPLDPMMLENAGAPPAIRDLVLRCTAKVPRQRLPIHARSTRCPAPCNSAHRQRDHAHHDHSLDATAHCPRPNAANDPTRRPSHRPHHAGHHGRHRNRHRSIFMGPSHRTSPRHDRFTRQSASPSAPTKSPSSFRAPSTSTRTGESPTPTTPNSAAPPAAPHLPRIRIFQ